MTYYGVYATAWECVSYLNIHDEQTFLVNDIRFYQFTQAMSRKFDTLAKRSFLPERATYQYDHPDPEALAASISFNTGYVSYPNVLQLDHDLLSLITLTTNNGLTVISADNVILRTGPSLNYPPYDTIELKTDGTQNVFLYSGTPQSSNDVEGIYGYHEDYASAWHTIDTIQNVGDITSTETSLEVTDADAEDELGVKPRFQQQQVLRFGTTNAAEMVYVVGVNYSNNTLAIVRGVNGSTAAPAATNDPIQIYRPMDEIKHAMLILSSHAYRRKDSVGKEGERNLYTTAGVLVIPQQIPQEVADMVLAFKRPFIGSA